MERAVTYLDFSREKMSASADWGCRIYPIVHPYVPGAAPENAKALAA
jgi:hypothetical protein